MSDVPFDPAAIVGHVPLTVGSIVGLSPPVSIEPLLLDALLPPDVPLLLELVLPPVLLPPGLPPPLELLLPPGLVPLEELLSPPLLDVLL